METKSVSEIATELVQQIKHQVLEVKELNLGTFKGVFALVVLVVRFVERLACDGEIVKGDKKELAIQIVDQFIDIPFVPAIVEKPLLSWIVGLLIDQVVEAFNRTLGKLWLSRVN